LRDLTHIEDAVLACVFAGQEEIYRALERLEREGFITRDTEGRKSYTLARAFDWLLRAKDGKLSVIGPMERPG
jgi:DNA-binding transcriptional regulator PaaX